MNAGRPGSLSGSPAAPRACSVVENKGCVMMAGTEPSGEISLRSGRSESGLTGKVHYSAADSEVYDHASEGQAKKTLNVREPTERRFLLARGLRFRNLGFCGHDFKLI